MIFGPSGAGTGGISGWVSGTVYAINDVIYYANYLYQCIVAHTAGASLEVDIQAGKWVIVNKPLVFENLAVVGNNFEDNDVGGWTATGCATVTNGLPVSVGSGGAAFSSSNGGRAKGANTSSPSVTSSGPINGLYSLNLATTGAGTIGDGYISQIYNIPIKYQAKVLVAEVAFKVASGTPVMGGTSSDTYAIAIYDPINNAWLGNAGVFSFTQSSGVGIARTTFQTASNTTGVQIFIYSPVAPTGASSLLLDDISIYKQDVVYGSPVTDWQSYTPTYTGFGTVVTDTAQWRRVGDSIELRYKFTSGTNTAVQAYVSLPPGLTFSNPSGILLDGQGNSTDSTYPTYAVGIANGESRISFFTNNSSLLSLLGNNFANGTVFYFYVRTKITGWSSSVVMSSDAATNTLATARSASDGQSIPSSTSTTIDFSSTALNYVDTNAAWRAGVSYNSGTGAWTTEPAYIVQVPGQYDVQALVTWAAVAGATGERRITINLNGTDVIGNFQFASDVNPQSRPVSAILNCVAGDVIKIVGYHTQGSALAIQNEARRNRISIKRISGPSQIASSESIGARYTNASASVSGAYSDVTWGTKDYDSHGFTTTTLVTILISGKYDFSGQLCMSGTAALNNVVNIQLYKNSATNVGTVQHVYGGAITTATTVLFNFSGINCLAGDTFKIRVASNATSPGITSDATLSFFNIKKVGN